MVCRKITRRRLQTIEHRKTKSNDQCKIFNIEQETLNIG